MAQAKVSRPVKKEAHSVVKASRSVVSHGVGRRKSSIARVWLRRGKGVVVVNGKDVNAYFDTDISRRDAVAPVKLVSYASQYDIEVNVCGGGKKGQSGAMCLGIARAFLGADEQLKGMLRHDGFLTVDSRVKERKKYGQRGARRKFQFVKR